jgi:heme a synthase
MTRPANNPWLHRFAVLTTVATLALIGVGGLVTSHGVGMAVPDWPTTYGYNMFLFPPAQWVGGIFYEHSHRLLASFVGLLTTILAVWLWVKEPRRSVRWAGVAAFVAVVLQGVLGGLRVTLYKDEIGIFHAILAQSFFVLLSCIAVVTSTAWGRAVAAGKRIEMTAGLRALGMTALTLVFVQLVLGASMRHQHAGLAVRDFPLAYGKLWPPTDAESITRFNRERLDDRDYKNITPFQIHLHMTHRIGAVLTLACVAAFALGARKQASPQFAKAALVWLALIIGQAALGAVTVWSNKAADVATAHVVLGAANLVCGATLVLVAWRFNAARICTSLITVKNNETSRLADLNTATV